MKNILCLQQKKPFVVKGIIKRTVRIFPGQVRILEEAQKVKFDRFKGVSRGKNSISRVISNRL